MRSVALPVLVRALLLPITAVASMATTAVLVQSFGATTYGYVVLIATITQMVPAADLGMGAAVMNAFGDPAATPERRRLVLAASMKNVLIATLAGSVVVTVLASFGHLASILGAERDGIRTEVAIGLVFVVFLMSIPLGILQRVLIASGKNVTVVLLQAGIGPLTLMLTLASVALGVDPTWMPIIWPASTLLMLLPAAFLAFREEGVEMQTLTRLVFSRTPADIDVWAAARPMIVIMIALPLSIQSHRVILANFNGLAAVAEYSLMMSVYFPAVAVLSTAGQALWSHRLRSRSVFESPAAYRKMLGAFSAVGLAAAVAIATVGRWLVEDVVADGAIAISAGLAASVALLVLAQTVQTVPNMMLTDPSGLKFQAYWLVPMSIAAVCGSVLMAPPLGAAGPILATSFAVIAFQIVPSMARVEHRYRSLST